MKICCVSYREWALKIYHRLEEEFKAEHQFYIIGSKEEFDQSRLEAFEPDMILFYGWSWMVPECLIERYMCVMLHPSPLPKYRGGSPIQNQIIRGEDHSKVTLFIMTEDLDAGDILAQGDLSLSGHLSDIFERISDEGFRLSSQVIRGEYERKPQDHSQATYFKRRTPADSEITIDDLMTRSAKYIFDKIRMLEDPYPNAFIKTSDGKKIKIKFAEIDDKGA